MGAQELAGIDSLAAVLQPQLVTAAGRLAEPTCVAVTISNQEWKFPYMIEAVGTINVRPVDPSEQTAVLALLQPFVEQKKLLRRTIDELDTLLPNGFVAETDGRIVGFATLDVYSRKLAEIRALVVAADQQGRGVGQQLVEACIQRARDKGIMEVMAISSAESFFLSCGFGFTLPDEKKAFFLQTGLRQ